MVYSDEELERLLAEPESDLAERKESFGGKSPDTVREAVCAFANDLPGHRRAGVAFIGVRDDGTPAGLPITDDLLLKLADIKTDGNILPPPSMTVERRRLRGCEVAVITVLPSDSPPVRCRGRIHVRIGPRRGLATAQDERILNERRRWRDLPFDAHPVPSAVLADLSRRMFEDEYLPAAVAPDVLAANERSYEQKLAALKMVASADDPTPTVLGLLVLGIRPQDFLPGAYIQFLRIEGTEITDDITDEHVCDGPISDQIRQIEDKMASHNRTHIDFTSEQKERRRSSYPVTALQQLIRNAIMHRTYEATNAPVKVYWFSDRIEIHNPGGPFGAVTLENFGTPGATDYRNPNIAEAMKVLGYVQRFGAGIAIARRSLRGEGHPEPVFEVTQAAISCRIGGIQ